MILKINILSINMNLEILIIYSIYNYSPFSCNDSHLTEFSESFIKEDLNCIKNIFSEGMTSSQYQLIGKSAQTYLPLYPRQYP